jgi:phosphate-selective porin
MTCMADDSAPPQHVGDRSIGEDQNFLIRRARLVLSGDISDHMFVYLQPDFAVTTPGSSDGNHFAQIRDWYADLYLDLEKVYRFRVGQSKVPYGWENLQSSSNRAPLDRSDSLNSAVRNERDLGAFFYWTPTSAQDFFKEVLDLGLKGSGNYGVFGIGVYDGQGGSFVEQNDNLHIVSRLTWPIYLASCHHAELGVQAYSGRYTVLSSPISPLGVGAATRPDGTLETGNRRGLQDERVGGTFVWYPEPIGFQAEWNVGRGPALNDAHTEVVVRSLTGGYLMTMMRLEGPRGGIWFPFCRWSYYEGGYKSERNAPYADIDEWELGVEWQATKQVELTSSYLITDRTNTTAINAEDTESYRQFNGQVARFQLQVNY